MQLQLRILRDLKRAIIPNPRSPVTYILGSCPWVPIYTYTSYNPRTHYMGTWASRVRYRYRGVYQMCRASRDDR